MIKYVSDFTELLKQRNHTPFVTDNITNLISETNNMIKYTEPQYNRGQGLESTKSGTGYLLCLMPKQSKYAWNDLNHTQRSVVVTIHIPITDSQYINHYLLQTMLISTAALATRRSDWFAANCSKALSATLTAGNNTNSLIVRVLYWRLLTYMIRKLLIEEKYQIALTNI